jgi:hypothetical protein
LVKEKGVRVMKLYYVWQEENNGYDTYDSMVVAAPSYNIAKNMNPANNGEPINWREENSLYTSWATHIEFVQVKLIGRASPGIKQGIICSSFNAG